MSASGTTPSKTPPGCTCSSSTSLSPACTLTDCAAGRSARTSTPPLYLCAPRIECGSPCSRRTMRSRSGADAAGVISLRLHEAQDALDGDAHPVRAVVDLVVQLVHGLLQLENGQELGCRLLARRQQRRVHLAEVPL